MIQIPITLPKWNTQDIINLVRDFVEKGITDDKYKQALDENIDLISTAIENNPREIKRFLNNFIVAYEIFSPKKNDTKRIVGNTSSTIEMGFFLRSSNKIGEKNFSGRLRFGIR